MRGCLWVCCTLLAATAASQSGGPFEAEFAINGLVGGDGRSGFAIAGIDRSDNSGSTVSSAGDFNGDGIDDVLIGAPFRNLNGDGDVGQAYVVFGRPNPYADGRLNLRSLFATRGLTINGIDDNEDFGAGVSWAGDVNNDGNDDIIISRPRVGAAYVVFGGAQPGGTGVLDIADLDGANGFRVLTFGTASIGGAVGGGRDVNGDGIDDLIVGGGSPAAGVPGAGSAFVVYGGSDVGASGLVRADDLDGTNGFRILGSVVGSGVGVSVSLAGDINGDTIDDIVLGTRVSETTGPPGLAYVVFGSSTRPSGTFDLGSIDGTNGFAIFGTEDGGPDGFSVSGAGDVNDDGFEDVIIGQGDSGQGGDRLQSAHVVFGGPTVGEGGGLELSLLDGTNGFALVGVDPGDHTGRAVSGAGDVTGDGIDDLLIGAPNVDSSSRTNAGEAYLVFGRAGLGASGSVPLSGLNGANGVVFTSAQQSGLAGSALAGAGDFNNDGIGDVIIGAPNGNLSNTLVGSGVTYVVFGRSTTPCDLADTNNDGVVSPGDYNAWILAFNTDAPECDQNRDGLCTPGDFNAWILNYNAGCP